MTDDVIWIRPLDIDLLQRVVFEHLAGPDTVLVLKGGLASLDFPQEFSCSLPGERALDPARNRSRAFGLDPSSWQPLATALRESYWESGKIEQLEIRVADQLAFLVGDSFHPECVSIRVAAPASLVAAVEAANAALVYERPDHSLKPTPSARPN